MAKQTTYAQSLQQDSTPMLSESVYDVGKSDKYGKSYSSLVSSNPYATMDYRKSGWQQFLEKLGFRTNYDAYRESLALQAKEFDAQLAQKAYNEQFDSAESQVERLRAAGINPDIAGDVSAGSSSAPVDDGNPPISPQADEFGQLQNFGSMVIAGINLATGLASTGFDFVQRLSSLRGQNIDNDNKLMSTAFDALMSVVSPEDMDNFMNSDLRVQATNYSQALSEVFGKRRAKKYISAVNRFATGLTGHDMEMKLRNSFVDNWTSYHDKTGSGFSMFEDVMKEVRHTLSKDFFDTLRNTAKSNRFSSENEIAYQSARQQRNTEGLSMPEIQAQNESMSSTYSVDNQIADWQLKKRNLAMRDSFEKLIHRFNTMADNGNWFAGLASIALSFLGNRYFGM